MYLNTPVMMGKNPYEPQRIYAVTTAMPPIAKPSDTLHMMAMTRALNIQIVSKSSGLMIPSSWC